ncbi:acyl-CoA synthetase FdrA [Moorella sp. Hama-1]|uniref:acyl-CoA synthetase FdrA n=1 Tax=Moorella sp. Hama-1 TaxID=2138101 RepID=UPI000D6435E6|nr:acyl-CoA synthetase FdrA [Moorella sp. Hama-1]
MVIRWLIKPKTYQDSVKLMKLSAELRKQDGVQQASVVMATEMNKGTLQDIGMLVPEVANANPNDLAIVVAAATEEQATKAVELAENLLTNSTAKQANGKQILPKTLRSAVEALPDANLALISVPGTYAAAEAIKALNLGLNVHLFSDNVTLEDEIRLKQIGTKKGLLVMGPDCGTAIINGVPLAFANIVARGKIGIIGASGTGIQEATVLIDHLGGGISHAIGTGGRDLSDAVGGLMMLQGIDLLEDDPSTEVILLVSKPAGPKTTIKIIDRVKKCKKPVVVSLLKGDLSRFKYAGVIGAPTIEDAAYKAVALANGEEAINMPENFWGDFTEQIVVIESKLEPDQRYIRGLFTGGTLADEAMVIVNGIIGDVFSNIPLKPELKLPVARESHKHTIVDLGDDEFTRGRPHPMIDPLPRNERLLQEYADPEVGVILCDVVAGYGSHSDPAGELASSVARARSAYPKNHPAIIAFVCGTEADPQPLSEQVRTLEKEKIFVLPSNAEAARVAAKVIKLHENRGCNCDFK